MKRVLLSWSSGKDCAWALHLLRQQPDIEIVALLTTINVEFDRVAMHGPRRVILEAQATAAQLPLWSVPRTHGGQWIGNLCGSYTVSRRRQFQSDSQCRESRYLCFASV